MNHIRGDTYVALSHIKGGPAAGGEYDFAFDDNNDIPLAALGVTLPLRAFAVFSAGAIKLQTQGGKIDTFADGELVKGAVYPEVIKKIFATGTSVQIVRLYF